MKVIAIGNAAYKVAKQYTEYSLESLTVIDHREHLDCSWLKVRKQSKPDQYEENFSLTEDDFRFAEKQEILLLVSGGSTISALTLMVSKMLIDLSTEINLVYIQPETSILSSEKKLLEKTVRLVLKEKALSNNFKRMLIFDNQLIINLVRSSYPDVNFLTMYKHVNQIIGWNLKMLFDLFQSEMIYGSELTSEATYAKIETLAALNLETFETANLALPIFPREQHYFIALTQEELSNKETTDKILKQIEKLNNQETNIQISFSIHGSSSQRNEGCVINRSSVIENYIQN